jgi:myotubularin-related protein 10/11/12
MSCCVSSLVELMADSHYRSISGFESLIQKEWVALGHSFTTRHNLVVTPASEEDQQIVSQVEAAGLSHSGSSHL